MTSLLPALLCLGQLWSLATGGEEGYTPVQGNLRAQMASVDETLKEKNQLNVQVQISECDSLPGLNLDKRMHFPRGTLPQPTICAGPGSVVPSGSSVTLWCWGTTKAQEYCLYTDEMSTCSDRQKPLEPGDRATFFFKRSYGGKYSCAYRSPSGWSERSDTLELVVTGIHRKPSLSALPSPVVTAGGNMTLQCASEQGFDRFILTKEGEHRLSWTLDSEKKSSGLSQALFTVGPVNSSLNWTFRCYGSFKKNLWQWSDPSDPLDVQFSGPSVGPSPTPTEPISTAGLTWDQYVLIGVLVAFVLLLFFFSLFFGCRHQGRGRMSGAALKDPQPGQTVELDSQAVVSDTPKDVTYAHLNLLALRQETSAPLFSLSEDPPDEPSVYASLAIH
ncbi:leukocyte immunoglobulin-like receptor subfamily A member 5 [Molossus nigricans]